MSTRPLLAYLLLILLPLAVTQSQAMPMIFSGVDQGSSTTNSDAASSAWQASVGSFTLDNLDGLTGTTGIGGSVTSSLGNTYSTPDDLLGTLNFTFAVLDGTSIRLTKQGSLTQLLWDLVTPIDAFGFFSRGNDGGVVTITYDDGAAQSFDLTAARTNSTGDNLFWGIEGLGAGISQVGISSTDPGDNSSNPFNSFYDRFAYSPANAVPEPLSAGLAVVGLLALATTNLRSNRRCKASGAV